jgi:hypothetical protein
MDENKHARTDAEAGPIVVHETTTGWQVDYGSYAQGYHPSREEATEAAVEAAKREGRRVVIRTVASEFAAEDRDRVADQRDRIADQREAIANERERLADLRELAFRRGLGEDAVGSPTDTPRHDAQPRP